jgi:phosphomannomutase
VSAAPEAVRAWIAGDPDPATRHELERILADPAPAAQAELTDRFDGRLRFGTAGLRGVVAAGPNRMNRAVVRAATSALAIWLDTHQPDARHAGVAIGCDARHGSDAFADEAAAVLVGAGFRVHLLERPRPTPLLAFAVRHLGAAAGVMITASHNPAADNGYKLYLSDGAQIVPPVDAEIEALMDQVGPLSDVVVGDLDGPLAVRHGPELVEAFVEAVAAVSPKPAGGADLTVVYTAMHGVALTTFEAALARAGFGPIMVVAAQARPDPDFPTVAFPNPEEPGALDLALAEARRVGADLVIAHDPDGDRLAVAAPDPAAEGGWRALTGDQVGWLLGQHALTVTAGDPHPEDRLVATTVVSSSLLAKLAAEARARYAETLTGFKWIVRGGDRVPGSRFVFGYEEALGYCVGTVVRDKDGIGAALSMLGLASEAAVRGATVLDLLDDLEARHGVHLTAQMSIRSSAPESSMAALRAAPPADLGGRAVVTTLDLLNADEAATGLARSDVLVYRLDGARVVVRPSGTEPKLKVYFEVIRPVTAGDLAAARTAAGAELAGLRADLSGRLTS